METIDLIHLVSVLVDEVLVAVSKGPRCCSPERGVNIKESAYPCLLQMLLTVGYLLYGSSPRCDSCHHSVLGKAMIRAVAMMMISGGNCQC